MFICEYKTARLTLTFLLESTSASKYSTKSNREERRYHLTIGTVSMKNQQLKQKGAETEQKPTS